eukprot:scaffold17139_cov19-Prasinocladus_malaysianus.AAC.1
MSSPVQRYLACIPFSGPNSILDIVRSAPSKGTAVRCPPQVDGVKYLSNTVLLIVKIPARPNGEGRSESQLPKRRFPSLNIPLAFSIFPTTIIATLH